MERIFHRRPLISTSVARDCRFALVLKIWADDQSLHQIGGRLTERRDGITMQLSPTGNRSSENSNIRIRWAVDVESWQPSAVEYDYLLSLVPEEERQDVQRFRFQEDRKRALMSRLMQRACLHALFGIDVQQAIVKRTKGRKPFAASAVDRRLQPNFNYNVSHEGRYVVLATEPLCVCGVDVAAPHQLRRPGSKEALQEALSVFQEHLTGNEWAAVHQEAGGDAAQEALFRRFWSLKEGELLLQSWPLTPCSSTVAFVKARGDGIAFAVGRAEFHFRAQADMRQADVVVDGTPDPRWRFYLHKLGDDHFVSVARGPPEAIIDAFGEFTATLQKPRLTESELQAELDATEPPFQLLNVPELLPASLRRDLFSRQCA